MVTDTIQNLLVLQERNNHVNRLRAEIERLPAEVKKLEALIQEEENNVQLCVSQVKELEVERKQVELDVSSAEEQITKYKNQQLLVKKNDEYQALTKEIEQTAEKISELETAELELMEKIDLRNRDLNELKEEVGKRVKYQHGLIKECAEKLKNLKGQLGDAVKVYQEQISQMDVKNVSIFESLKTQIKRAPYIAEISDQNCGGCHMRVSNDILKRAKMGEISHCDQCSRVVYVSR